MDELGQLIRYSQVKVSTRELDQPTVLLPPVYGSFRLLIDPRVDRQTRDHYLIRHEIGHVLAGDIEEPTKFQFHYPLPEAEMVADLFAFADLVTESDLSEGVEWIEERIRRMVRVENKVWYLRVPRVAEALIGLQE